MSSAICSGYSPLIAWDASGYTVTCPARSARSPTAAVGSGIVHARLSSKDGQNRQAEVAELLLGDLLWAGQLESVTLHAGLDHLRGRHVLNGRPVGGPAVEVVPPALR